MRTVVFLNHATPEDNQFTAWLAAKLTLTGYEVWCDFHRLLGGQDFWKVIEDTIRQRTARFIAITSRIGQNKMGVLSEISVATSVEREIPEFIIPIRLDDLPFADFKITVHRKNAIDFHGDWQRGLRVLLTTLQKYQVPRDERLDIKKALPWLVPDEQLRIALRIQPEVLETNWVVVNGIPEVLNTVQIPTGVGEILRTDENSHIPWFQYQTMLCGFATPTELQQNFSTTCMTRSGSRVALTAVLQGESKTFLGLTRADASRLIVRMLRQAWGLKMRSLGLHSFSVAGKLVGWFVPNELLPSNKSEFTEASGKKRRKNLVGKSETRKVYWHFGVSAYPLLDDPFRFELRTHILFSEDGHTPLESIKRMHGLRRSFCRNWWNDHFRSLFRAFLAFASGGTGAIALPGGGAAQVILASEPLTLRSPVSLSDSIDLPTELFSVLDEDAEVDRDEEEDEEEEEEAESDGTAQKAERD